MLKIFADTDCDIDAKIAKEHDLGLISMPYIEGDREIRPYVDWQEFEGHAFYDRLRRGELASTCGLSPENYIEYFEPVFVAGDDILYVHFSANMTSTFNAMRLALLELQERYPQRKFYAIDCKAITIGARAIVLDVIDMKESGKSIEEIMEWAKTGVEHYACYFYADNLRFFARSGRVSGISATMANLLSIKPIINMDSEGKMGAVAKAKGRINAMNKVLDYVEALQDDMKNHRVIIAHTDAPVWAEKFVALFKQRFGEGYKLEMVLVNPTAGAHCGPDTIGICFHAKSRQ